MLKQISQYIQEHISTHLIKYLYFYTITLLILSVQKRKNQFLQYRETGLLLKPYKITI